MNLIATFFSKHRLIILSFLSFFTLGLLFNLQISLVSAQEPSIILTPPKDPTTGRPVGYSKISDFITNVLVLLYGIAVIFVLFMLVWGAYEWLTSGGDKESVARARGRILNALIGLAVLAVAYALFLAAARFLGFSATSLPIPTPP